MRPVLLIIRDGFGYNIDDRFNAVDIANTPHFDEYDKKYPWTLIDASGEPVGVPDGFQGSSEVGHLNMGAGRVVIQEIKRISDAISDGSLFDNDTWRFLIENWKNKGSRLHFFGLLQDAGVHAHQEHLFALMRKARSENPNGKIIVHPFLDGRDTAPQSCTEYLHDLNTVIEEIGNARIGTFMGRYYGMDRGRTWPLTDMAYNAIVYAKADKVTENPILAVQHAYKIEKTPDGQDMYDEYISPHIVKGYDGVLEGDCVFHSNYRQDRAIQLSMAFVDDNYPGKIEKRKNICYVGFTKYYDEFKSFLIGEIGGKGGLKNLVGEVISKAGMRQLRLSETQKFRHVTSFFNGKSTTPFPGEDQVEIKGRFDPATFADHPEMEAYRITDAVIENLEKDEYQFIVVNYANGDMVGHTGVLKSSIKAVEILDETVSKLIDKALEKDAHIILTADHGNCDQMRDYETDLVKTSHTIHPVKLYYIANDTSGIKLIEHGKLSDIGPTVLRLLGLDVPEEMTADNIIIE